MANYENAESSFESRKMRYRDLPKGCSSYFFSHQIERCLTEQYRVLGSKLAEKEKEAQIIYEKSLSGNFSDKAQIDTNFVHLFFDSDEAINLDLLIEDLGMRIVESKRREDVTRLLDLLYVTGNSGRLLEQQAIHGVQYDLYDDEAKGKFGSMATFAQTMLDSGKAFFTSSSLALVFSLLATRQDELVASGLLYLAKVLGCTWDALLLAKYFYGVGHETTRMVQDVWSKAVMDDQFLIFKMSKSIVASSNLKEMALALINFASSKKDDPVELIAAYRCLAITLATMEQEEKTLDKRLKMTEVSNLMRNIYITLLGWGKIAWAKVMMVDVSKRASPGDIPSDICQIAFNCHIELMEALIRSQDHTAVEPPHADGLFKHLAAKWRVAMSREGGEMCKMRTKDVGAQKVLYQWIQQLGSVLAGPVVEHDAPNQKMEYVHLAAQFLPEMLRWAATGGEDEPLRLVWYDRAHSKIKLSDPCIVDDETSSRRGRSLSVASRKSKDDGRNQKRKGGETTKEERPAPSAPRAEGAKQFCAPLQRQDIRQLQTSKPLEQQHHSQIGTAGDYKQNKTSNKDNNWREHNAQNTSQDARHQGARTYSQHNAAGHAAHVVPSVADSSTAKVVHVPRGAGSVQTSGHITDQTSILSRCAPTPAAEISDDKKTDIDEHTATGILPAEMVEFAKQRSEAAAARSRTDVSSSSTTLLLQQQPVTQPTHPVPEPHNVTPEVTMEQIQSRLNETMEKMRAAEAAAAAAAAETLSNTGQQQQQPPAATAVIIPQQPTMGTAAANEARARRSAEMVQTAEQQLQQEEETAAAPEQLLQQQSLSADAHYEALMGQQELDDGRSIAPDPAEMNKLFTGTAKGHSTLPPCVQAEQQQEEAAAAAAAAARTTIMAPQHAQPSSLPVPALVAQAGVAAETSTTSSMTILTPPQGEQMLPPPPDSYGHPLPRGGGADYRSQSAESMLTPITEVSEEAFGTNSTAYLITDGAGLSNNFSTDAVFEHSQAHEQPHHQPLLAATPIDTPSASASSAFQAALQAQEFVPRQMQTLAAPPVSVLLQQQPESNAIQEQQSPPTMAPVSSSQPPVQQQQQFPPAQHQQQAALEQMPTVTPTYQEVQNESAASSTVHAANAQTSGAVTPLQPSPSASATSLLQQAPAPCSMQQQYYHEAQQPMQRSGCAEWDMVTQKQQQQMQPPIPHNTAAQVTESSPMPTAPTGQQLHVECAEPEMREMVTSDGVKYKFSPSNSNYEVTVSAATSTGAEVGQPQSNLLDSLLNGMTSVSDVTVTGEDQGVATWSMPSDSARSMTMAEIDEHAALRREAASERGDAASEIASSIAVHPFPVSYSQPPSVPSTTMTTPEPQLYNQLQQEQQSFNYAAHNQYVGGQYKGEDAAAQMSAVSHSASSVLQSASYVQPESAAVGSEPQLGIPAYQDPFDLVSRSGHQWPQHLNMEQQLLLQAAAKEQFMQLLHLQQLQSQVQHQQHAQKQPGDGWGAAVPHEEQAPHLGGTGSFGNGAAAAAQHQGLGECNMKEKHGYGGGVCGQTSNGFGGAGQVQQQDEWAVSHNGGFGAASAVHGAQSHRQGHQQQQKSSGYGGGDPSLNQGGHRGGGGGRGGRAGRGGRGRGGFGGEVQAAPTFGTGSREVRPGNPQNNARRGGQNGAGFGGGDFNQQKGFGPKPEQVSRGGVTRGSRGFSG